ncbi:head maturation protease, ClpP-related [Paenibacillus odorifer]|uniref:head maturation protease, ClpP-related n=1 Tax=Paenibacillus odorifer TaxID=189426 RepID=UPI00096DB531|nr:head maturation protease, ClpP-related [Paenibacillus odorifer]OME59477.1 phage tail protein [Paenibacillus odorifer]
MRKFTKQDYFKSFKNQSYVEQLQRVGRKFETIRNETTGSTEMTIYGLIGNSWWEDSVSASDIDNVLKSINGDVVIYLNSPGGDAFDGIAIFNRLMDYKAKHKAKITIHIDGWACSAASVIAMAADELIMGLGSMLMIHEASSLVWGSKTEMRKEANVLDELEEGIIDIYMTKANISREEIRSAVDAETWYGAQKAVDIGFATSTAAADGKEKEITQLRTQLANMQNEIQQLKSNSPKDEPKPSATAAPRFIF